MIGCGGDDGGDADDEAGPDRDAYVAALVASYDNPFTTPDDHGRMAEATVEVLGLGAPAETGTADELREAVRLQDFGSTPDEATAGDLVDALDACVTPATSPAGGRASGVRALSGGNGTPRGGGDGQPGPWGLVRKPRLSAAATPSPLRRLGYPGGSTRRRTSGGRQG